MVQASTVINIVWVAVWFLLARGEIGLRATEALSDVLPYALLALLAVGVACVVTLGMDSLLLSLVVKVLVVAALYPAALWLMGSTILRESLQFVTKLKIEN